jgi:transposase-like protein
MALRTEVVKASNPNEETVADIENSPPVDPIRDKFTLARGMPLLVEEMLNQVMEAEITEFLQADTYDRTDQRRRYDNITTELCGTDFAKSGVSDLCKDLDDTVDTRNNRDLHTDYPFVLVDGIYIKVRRESGEQPTSLLIAVGVNEGSYREIIGFRVANSESKQFWLEMFRWLKDRQEHFKRKLKDKLSTSLWSDFKSALDCVFEADSPAELREPFQELTHRFKGRADKAIRAHEAGLEEAIALLALPTKYREHLRTTNMIERLIQEARCREKVIRIFPHDGSARRILGAYNQEEHEKCSTGHRYLKMDEFYEWKESLGEEDSDELRAAE